MRESILGLFVLVVFSGVNAWSCRNRLRRTHILIFVVLAVLCAATTAALYPKQGSLRDMSGILELTLAIVAGIAMCWFGSSALFASLLLTFQDRTPGKLGVLRRQENWNARIGLTVSPRYREIREFGLTLGLLSWGLVSLDGLYSAVMAGRMASFVHLAGLARPVTQTITFKDAPGLFALQIAIWLFSALGPLVWAIVRLARTRSL